MTRKYDIRLLEKLKEREGKGNYKGQELIIKRLPDCDEDGAMDPRLFEDQKKMLKMLKIMPMFMVKKMMKVDPEHIDNLREMFNGIKSVPVVTREITTKKHEVETAKGITCDVYQYTNEKTTKESPVLYYIHGGGFFGGHHGVVEESLKLMVEKFGFTIFSVDYRLAPEHPYPNGHEDVYAVEKTNMVKAQLLLYPTLNMCGVEDEFFKWDISLYPMIPSQKKGLSKMLKMFGGMTGGLEPLLKCKKEDVCGPYLNPYTRKDPENNPPTFVTAGEHDYLKVETLAWAAKLHKAGVETKAIVYNGLGHAYFDNCGVLPQTEDCIEEMGKFIIEHTK